MIRRAEQLSAFEALAPHEPVGRMVTSVSTASTNADLIADVAPLYLTGRVLDVTYGTGGWWRRYRPDGLVATDLDPARAHSARADFTRLPFPDRCVDAVAYDPPYMPQGGVGQATEFAHRFGLAGARSRAVVDQLVATGLAECKRVTRQWVLVKCTDYVNGRQFHLGHVVVANTAAALDLEPWDLIVHASGPGPGHNLAEQLRARRAHSYLLVYRRRARS